MKLLIIVLSLLMILPDANAQLLKKLKEKAANAIDPKKPAASNNNTQDNNAAATGGEKATETKAPPSNGNVVFSLADDEIFLYDETEVLALNNTVNYSFVVSNKKNEFFLIENGSRSGPFKQAPLKSVKPAEEEDESSSGSNGDNISSGNDNKDQITLQYSKTIDGKLYIVFNGKNYGPYDYVSKMLLSRDKKHFFALVTIGGESPMVTKMGMGYAFMVSDEGLNQKVGTSGMAMPTRFSASKGFKYCMATVIDQKNQKAISVTSAGNESEGSMADIYSGNSSNSFVNDKGDIVSIPAQSPTQVLVNGKEAAAFKVPVRNMDRLILTPDISKSIYYEKGKLYRANGTEESLSGIVFPKIVILNNETSVYYFKVYKNENGVKDVYLCKKVI